MLKLDFKSNAMDFIDSDTLWDENEDGSRAFTAPARPLTDIEEFRRSNEFSLLEQAVLSLVCMLSY